VDHIEGGLNPQNPLPVITFSWPPVHLVFAAVTHSDVQLPVQHDGESRQTRSVHPLP